MSATLEPQPASTGLLRFAEVLTALEAELVPALELVPIALPDALSRMQGSYRDQPVFLEARAYSSARVRYARFVSVHGADLQIANALLLSEPSLALPIFGVDLIARRDHGGLAVIDLSPVRENTDERATIIRVLSGSPPFPRRGELPAWARAWFSQEATFANVDAARVSDLEQKLSAYGRAFVELARAADPLSPAAARKIFAAHDAYGRAHREEDRGLHLLEKMFDPALARCFLNEVLFPEGAPAS